MTKNFILTPQGMLCDLMKQGFMKPLPVRKPKKVRLFVACNGCLNWHEKGKHTSLPAARKLNLAGEKLEQRVVGEYKPV